MMFPRKQCPDIWTGEVVAALHCSGSACQLKGDSDLKKLDNKLHDLAEVFNEQRCGNGKRNLYYLKSVFELSFGYLLGHLLGLLLF